MAASQPCEWGAGGGSQKGAVILRTALRLGESRPGILDRKPDKPVPPQGAEQVGPLSPVCGAGPLRGTAGSPGVCRCAPVARTGFYSLSFLPPGLGWDPRSSGLASGAISLPTKEAACAGPASSGPHASRPSRRASSSRSPGVGRGPLRMGRRPSAALLLGGSSPGPRPRPPLGPCLGRARPVRPQASRVPLVLAEQELPNMGS